MTHALGTSRHPRRGLTLVELIVVVAIIIILVTIITAGYSTVTRSAKDAKNLAFVNSVGQGVEAFRLDFNDRIPPLVTTPPGGASAGLGNNLATSFAVPDMIDDFQDRAEAIREARYYSDLTLGIYLLGSSDLNGDGAINYSSPGNSVPNTDDGVDGPGYKDPGQILAWKRRDPADPSRWLHQPAQTGRTYGPYLEPGNDEFIENVSFNGAIVQQLVDSYGNPLRFYTGYPVRDP
ncbi:MAG: prepilin-type N-terminal cleavage/methylation domain-containing protein, partial [Planctomycetota bacterium]